MLNQVQHDNFNCVQTIVHCSMATAMERDERWSGLTAVIPSVTL
ncbi:MAG: hypothetical protein WAO19_15150 [Candidatus Kryptoniota bacterium]